MHFVAVWFHGRYLSLALGVFLTSLRLGDLFIFTVGTLLLFSPFANLSNVSFVVFHSSALVPFLALSPYVLKWR